MSLFRDVTISYALHPPETEVSIAIAEDDVTVIEQYSKLQGGKNV